ncbi:hypothetical protein BD410DRAFT_782251 [Rickenella mellea]|uniref:Uncharacterized protein n=1 Tax=Rickenella mellea TaxID=50990 RepID=A0A4Y7QLZ7_9AGAM|nr:hypothetical protein BD410DRAFT_782251 [Rickenella mellea]
MRLASDVCSHPGRRKNGQLTALRLRSLSTIDRPLREPRKSPPRRHTPASWRTVTPETD